jgi:hypothetical protein
MTDTGTPTEPRALKPITDWLNEHRDGELMIEATEVLTDLVRRVQTTGRNGSMSIVLTVKAAGDMVAVVDDVTVKPPKVDREVKSYFVDDDGNLSRSNPRQPELPGLKTVPPRTPAAEAKEVSA